MKMTNLRSSKFKVSEGVLRDGALDLCRSPDVSDRHSICLASPPDWDQSETISAAVSATSSSNKANAPSLTMAGSGASTTSAGSGPGSTNASGGPADHLWEDNWDDDDAEDEWNKRLREHLAA